MDGNFILFSQYAIVLVSVVSLLVFRPSFIMFPVYLFRNIMC